MTVSQLIEFLQKQNGEWPVCFCNAPQGFEHKTQSQKACEDLLFPWEIEESYLYNGPYSNKDGDEIEAQIVILYA